MRWTQCGFSCIIFNLFYCGKSRASRIMGLCIPMTQLLPLTQLVLLPLHSGTFCPLPHPLNPRHHILSLTLYHLFSMTFDTYKNNHNHKRLVSSKQNARRNTHVPPTPSQQPEHSQCFPSQVPTPWSVLLHPPQSHSHSSLCTLFHLTLQLLGLIWPIMLGQARKMLNSSDQNDYQLLRGRDLGNIIVEFSLIFLSLWLW